MNKQTNKQICLKNIINCRKNDYNKQIKNLFGLIAAKFDKQTSLKRNSTTVINKQIILFEKYRINCRKNDYNKQTKNFFDRKLWSTAAKLEEKLAFNEILQHVINKQKKMSKKYRINCRKKRL